MKTGSIVDTHLHLWDTTRFRYPWLDRIEMLNRPYLLENFDAARDGVEVERLVFVQAEAREWHDEVSWVSSLAVEDPRIGGIVARAPIEAGAESSDDVASLAENRLVKGIRRPIQFEDDPHFCLREPFVDGVRLLADYDLSFDLLIDYRHSGAAVLLVERCPDTRFVLDHLGKPNIRDHIIDPWREDLRRLSRFGSVWCKLSGLATEADPGEWTPEDLAPYVHHALECFGPERLMFGGDWPVSTQAVTYPRWVETVETLLSEAGCTDGELDRIFRANAVECYRLADP